MYLVLGTLYHEESAQSCSESIKKWSSQGFISLSQFDFHSLATVLLLAALMCFSSRLQVIVDT